MNLRRTPHEQQANVATGLVSLVVRDIVPATPYPCAHDD